MLLQVLARVLFGACSLAFGLLVWDALGNGLALLPDDPRHRLVAVLLGGLLFILADSIGRHPES